MVQQAPQGRQLKTNSAGRALALGLLFFATAAAAPAAAERPNLVAIVTDDQGRWAMGAYGNREIHTPNMDRIASEGALFTNAIVASPVCSPSRATYLTGLYPTQVGITDWISPQQSDAGLGLSAPTWPEALQAGGYATALVGKWHLGTRREFHPRNRGFDHFMGFLEGGNRPVDPTLEVDGNARKLDGALPDLLTDDAVAWVESVQDRPFALLLHFRAPHLPYGPVPETDAAHYTGLDPTIPEFPGMDREKLKASTKAYYASISSVDRNIGRLMDALERLGVMDSTIVVFTSDHGYNEGRHGINTKGNGHWIAGGVRGPKRPNMWETSILAPLAVRWPGVVRPGTRIDHPVSHLDMFRTVLGMTGVPVPAHANPRGMDLSPLLRGEMLPRREALFGQYDMHNNGLAYLRMVRTDRYKYIKHFHAHMMDELYDLRNDPDEGRNLIRGRSKQQEHQATISKLGRMLVEWMKSIDDPLLKDAY